MKILLDQNLSYRIIKKLNSIYPEINHVSNFNLQASDDKVVWEFAKNNDFTLVTQDSDFYDFSILKGFPPKIIWIKCGNTSTNNIIEILTKNYQAIKDFIEDDKYACFEIY
jgi:predicted nuclease of predicted toxin-antitoxin system